MNIGFVGKKGSGKSTACEHIAELIPNIYRLNFKDGMILEMKRTLPDTLHELGILYEMSIDELFKKKPPVMRRLMQNYGTDLRRKGNPDYWVDMWWDAAEQANSDGFIVVADDVRFLNEAAAIKEAKGILIKIIRDDLSSSDRHASELEMDEIEVDDVIHAEQGNFDDFYTDIETILAKHDII